MEFVDKINELALRALNNRFCEQFVYDGWLQIFEFIRGHPTKDDVHVPVTLGQNPITGSKRNDIVEMIIDDMLNITAPEGELRDAINDIKNTFK